jgi:hypothetical protein
MKAVPQSAQMAPGMAKGRPSKRTPEVKERLFLKLRTGYSMARSARWAGIHPKTAQRWLKADRLFLEAVVEAQIEGAPHADLVRWVNHPFRGKRPPRSKKKRLGPYPKPIFVIPQGWRFTSYRGG